MNYLKYNITHARLQPIIRQNLKFTVDLPITPRSYWEVNCWNERQWVEFLSEKAKGGLIACVWKYNEKYINYTNIILILYFHYTNIGRFKALCIYA